MLWRFTATGDTLWTRVLPDTVDRFAYSGCLTQDGGYALVGDASRGPRMGSNLLLIRTDSAGNEIWARRYGSAKYNRGCHVTATTDGGFLISGYQQVNAFIHAPYVVKVDGLGNVQWERTFGTLTQGDGLGVAYPLRDGGYIVAATHYIDLFVFEQRQQAVFYRLDSAGNTVWQRTIGPKRVAYEFYDIWELPDGSVVAAGQRCDADSAFTNNGVGYPVGFAMKICASGDSLWDREYRQLTGGSSHNYLRGFRPTPDGGFVGAGYLFPNPPDTGSYDAWAFRVDSAGYLRPNGPPVTVQCRPPVGVGLPTPAGAAALTVYPNPAPDGRYMVTGLAPGAVLVVCDALGRVVWRGAARRGTAEAAVDLSGAPPGVYCLRLTWPDGRITTRKLLR